MNHYHPKPIADEFMRVKDLIEELSRHDPGMRVRADGKPVAGVIVRTINRGEQNETRVVNVESGPTTEQLKRQISNH